MKPLNGAPQPSSKSSTRWIYTIWLSARIAFCSTLAVVNSGCMGKDGAPSKNAPPGDIAYPTNPANYVYGVEITPNIPSSSRAIDKYAISPSLPAGLSFDTKTGRISGNPTTITASAAYNITATNSFGSAFTKLTLAITDAPPTITYGGTTTLALTVGTPLVTITPTLAGGAPLSCASTPTLPAGLSVSSTCVVSGTPTSAATQATYTIKPTNSGGSGALPLIITVTDLPPAFSYATSMANSARGTAASSIPTSTGGVITSCSASPALPTGFTLGSTCAISGTPTALSANAAYTITATNSGGDSTANITIGVIDVAAPSLIYSPTSYSSTYNQAMSAFAPSNLGGYIATCTVAPSLPTGLSINSSTCQISGTPTAVTASASYTVTATNTIGSSAQAITLAITDKPPNFGYMTFSNSVVHGASLTLSAVSNSNGGTITSCSITPNLPGGLSISSTCNITGTTTEAATTTTYTVTGTNSGGSYSKTVQITVTPLPPSLTYSGSPFSFAKTVAITAVTPTNTGDVATTCTVSPAFPSGVALSSSCVISGTPTAISAATNYTITSRNSAGSSTVTISVAVTDTPPAITIAGSPFTYIKDSAITTVTPTNTGGTITSCASAPALPTGLSVDNSTCAISGTPTAVTAVASYVITATNAGGSSPVTISITVNDVAPTLSYTPSSYSFIKDTAIAAVVPTLGGGTVVSCTVSPALPTGLSLGNANCQVTGTPTTTSLAANYTVTATNTGGSASANLNITVNDAIPVIVFAGSPYTFTKGTPIAAQTPTNTGGAITSCSSNPALPAGLNINATTCSISGTPTAISAATAYTLSATNAGGTGTANINITVNDAVPVIAYSASPYTYTKNSLITTSTPTNSGGTITSCSSNPALPAGLSINNTTCAISGTPSAITATTTYTITATNTGGNGTTTIDITVNDVIPSIAYSGSPYAFTKDVAITTQTPTNSGGTITSCSSNPALPTGLSIDNSTCAISGTSTAITAAANYIVSATNTGGTATATINIAVNDAAPTLSYAVTTHSFIKNTAIAAVNATLGGGAVVSCAVNPALPAGLSLGAANCNITGTPTTTASVATYTVTATNTGGSASANLDVTVNDAIPVIAYVGSPYTYTKNSAIAAQTPGNTGGAITACSANPALPAGLSINNTSCAITGTPTATAAVTTYTITATNASGSDTDTIDITVNDVVPIIAYASAPFTYAKDSAISTATATNTGGVITACSSNPALPAGLSINNTTCAISGTPTAITAVATYTITATSSGGNGTANIDITVNDVAPAIAYPASPYNFTKDVAIAGQTPTNSGGTITGCSSNPALPTGLSINNGTCAITGTPTAITGIANYVVTASNTGGSATAVVNITVNDGAPVIDYLPTSYNFVYNNGSAIAALTPNNSGGTITSCTSTPALPTGLSLNQGNCSMTGTPTVVRSATAYTITATNSGGSVSDVITITVDDVVPAITYAAAPYTFTKDSAIADKTPANTGGTIVSCSVSPGLPAGLSLSQTCVISGTPTAVTASANYTISATNSGGTGTDTIGITVNDIVPTIAYAGSPYSFTIGVAIANQTPALGGGTVTGCSSNPALPTGLSLNATTCVISGTPTVTAAAADYVITASNSGGNNSDTVNITVQNGPPILSYSGSPFTYTKSTAITALNPTNTGGTITGCSSNPALPAGLSLSATCVLTGTPSTIAAASDYTITATNGAGNDDVTINITVNDAAPVISFNPSSVTTVQRIASSNITPSNSGGTITSCSVSPALPNGLSAANNCVISGTPTVITSATSYTLTGTNTGGSSSTSLTLTVKYQPQILFHSLTALTGAADGAAAGSNNIWKSSQDGTDVAKLTENANASLDSKYASWNAAGTSVVSSSLRAQNGGTDGATSTSYNIWTTSGTGTGPNHRTANTNVDLSSDGPPIFSPDGTKIAFASKSAVDASDNGTASDSYNIFIMNADGTSRTALTANTNAGLDSLNPCFSPDGTMIYFSSLTATDGSTNGTAALSSNIWRINSNGTGKTLLSNSTGASQDAVNPAVSPDGNTVVFAAKLKIGTTDASSYNIWKMNYDGTSRINLTSNTAANLDSINPKFSPSSAEITFASLMDVNASPSSSYNVWKMSASGLNQSALTTNTAASKDSHMPHFSPDGTLIAFSSLQNIGVSSTSSYNIWVMNSDGTGSPTSITSNTNAGLDSYLSTFNVWYAE